MNTEHSFVPERAAAQHCAELLRRGAEPADQIGGLAKLGTRLAPLLGSALARLVGGEAPTVTPLAPQEQSEHELNQQVGQLAANALYSTGLPGVSLLGSVAGTAVLRLVDRAYGGSGEHHGALPESFPLSAELLVQRLENALAECLGEALGGSAVEPLKRSTRLAEFAPFPAGAKLAVLGIEVMEGTKAPWLLTLALPLSTLPKLLSALGDGPAATPRRTGAADPAAAPFAALPLGLTATLVDMPVSLAVLAALEPGTVLPVAVARAVPLSIGGRMIASGTIGAQDDRIALRLTAIAN
ncbi:MAG: FliM/FliN family flagellar motor switch protein [Novosphingobium sp.]